MTERNERIHDLCLQWEKSTQLLKEARERDLAELHKQVRHLEEEVIPALRARADAAEAREKQLRNELTVSTVLTAVPLALPLSAREVKESGHWLQKPPNEGKIKVQTRKEDQRELTLCVCVLFCIV